MSVVRASGEVGDAERRYWRRASTSRPWWPWGVMRVACLLALYAFGAMLTAPQLPHDIKRQVLGWLEVTIAAPGVSEAADSGVARDAA